VPALLVGGAAVAAFGVSAWLGITGRNDLSGLNGSCAPYCSDEGVNFVKRELYASDIVLGLGIVGAAVSAYLFLRPPHSGGAATTHVGVAPTPGGVTLSFAKSL
jgi:hypothetical protein